MSSGAQYADICGRTVARAHPPRRRPAQISGYLGRSDAVDNAIAAFPLAYADQSERGHAVLKKAVGAGRAVDTQAQAFYNAVKPTSVSSDWQLRFQIKFLFPK